jgi:hypothetical protein
MQLKEPRLRTNITSLANDAARNPEPDNFDYAPKPKEPPRESDMAGELASQAVINFEKLRDDLDAIDAAVKKRQEQISAEVLSIKADIQQRIAIVQNGASSFLEQTGKWQTGLRDLFAKTDAQP